MVQESVDPLTGAARDAVLINPDDVKRLGLKPGDHVLLRSDHGELRCRVHAAPIASGNLQVHWPEGNALIEAGRRSAEARIPDYNAQVTIEPIPEREPATSG
jgi:anaerobic selenocysteine-containing dehydrogenase